MPVTDKSGKPLTRSQLVAEVIRQYEAFFARSVQVSLPSLPTLAMNIH
jgi:hypothetical protein